MIDIKTNLAPVDRRLQTADRLNNSDQTRLPAVVRRRSAVGIFNLSIWLTVLTLITFASGCASTHPPAPAPPAGLVFRVALLIPASGELATFGRMARNGVVLAFDQWNAQGGVLGQQIVWEIYDTDCSFDSARQATQQALEAGHQFIIGPICSEAAVGSAPIAAEAGALMISPTATHPRTTTNSQRQTRPTVFTMSYSYTQQGRAAAQFARHTLNVEKAAIIYQPTDLYARNLATSFANNFEAAGGQIVYQAAYGADPTDTAEILQAVEQAGAELIYLPGDHDAANRISRQLNALNLTHNAATNGSIRLLGSDAWQSDNLDVVSASGSYFPVHHIAAVDNAAVQNWIELYKSSYALQPDTLAALGYDTANILAQAVVKADNGEALATAKALEQHAFDGLFGSVTFDSDHTPVKPIPFVQVQENGPVYIATVEP